MSTSPAARWVISCQRSLWAGLGRATHTPCNGKKTRPAEAGRAVYKQMTGAESVPAEAIHQHDGFGLTTTGHLDVHVVGLEVTPGSHFRGGLQGLVGREFHVHIGKDALGFLGSHPFQQAGGLLRMLRVS